MNALLLVQRCVYYKNLVTSCCFIIDVFGVLVAGNNFCNCFFSCTLLMFSGNINDEYIRRSQKIGNVRY